MIPAAGSHHSAPRCLVVVVIVVLLHLVFRPGRRCAHV